MASKIQTITIDSILGGFAPTFQMSGADQYLDAIGIDPEAIGTFGGVTGKSLGAVMPTFPYSLLSTSTLGEAPMWVAGSASTQGVFVYGSGGTLHAISSADAPVDGGLVKPTNGAGNGMVAYNDYIYLSTTTDVYRYGRLSQTAPTLASWWVTGLSNSALVNGYSPSTRNITYPNHVLHFHNDGRIYVADYDATATDSPHGGLIHWFKTATDGTGGTSAFAALVLPPGFVPMALESYGTDLAILCTPELASGGDRRTGNAALFLWDTISNTYYRHVPIKETVATAMKVKNGEIYILAGNVDTDVKLIKYLGGDSFQTLVSVNEGAPPPAGAMEVFGDMVCWGGHVTAPTAAAGLFSYGTRSGQLKAALNMPVRINNTSSTLPIVSCVKSVERKPYPWIGWRTDTTASYGLDSLTNAGTQASRWRTKVYNIGKKFRIRRIRIPLLGPVSSGDSITGTIYTDSETASTALKTINTTNFPNSPTLCDFNSVNVQGYSNFYIAFNFAGTNQQGFALPITIDIEIDEL